MLCGMNFPFSIHQKNGVWLASEVGEEGLTIGYPKIQWIKIASGFFLWSTCSLRVSKNLWGK